MYKHFKILGLTLLFATLLVVNVSIASAFECADLNYQYGFTAKGPTDPNSSGGGTSTTPPASLADKLVVISEEPLGSPDNTTTFSCSRKIVCTGAEQPAPANSQNQPSPSTPTLKRECATTYTATSACSASTTKEINDQLAAGIKKGDTFTVCEPVMIYVSAAGTNLLYYYIGQVYRYMATLGGIIAVLIIIVAGVLRASAGDNTDRISKANAIITKCISGLVLLFLSAIILYVINPNFFVINS